VEGAVKRAALLLIVSLSGCTLLLKHPPDTYRPRDASIDADAAVDAGDAGDGCVPTTAQETLCSDTIDNDCDGQLDCFDFDCRGLSVCCRESTAMPTCLDSVDFVQAPSAAPGFTLSGSCDGTRIAAFGSPGATRAFITRECQPINFGMRFEIDFEIETDCGTTCDYAGFALTPVQTISPGSPLLSELRAVLFSDGSARVERAGRLLAEEPAGTFDFGAGNLVHLRVELEPGPDEIGRDVLFATVDLTQGTRGGTILTRQAIMPLADLRCLGATATGAGLFAAIEGAGGDVDAVGPLVVVERECSNPSQFRPMSAVVMTTPESCAAGGAGAPTLVNYCHANCSSGGTVQWDLWVDASQEQRADEIFRPIDFGICGYANSSAPFPPGPPGDDWVSRSMAMPPFLWPIPPSAREPSLLAFSDDDATPRVQTLRFAYAARTAPGVEIYAIRGGEMLRGTSQPPGIPQDLLLPSAAGCQSLRDPLLLARHVPNTSGFRVAGGWLLFTCEHAGGAPRTIGIVELDGNFAPMGTVNPNLLTPSIGAYAFRGVFAPEGFTEVDATTDRRTVRLWFSTRDGSGQVRLGYAQGRGLIDGAFPVLEPYPANPILDGASSFLGGDCSLGCTLTGASITPSFNDLDDFQFVVSRSRLTALGAVHDLVPLLQPRPRD
jgi:hypothetical protein